MSGRGADLAMLAAARAMLAQGLVTGSVGNISERRGDAVRITPTRLPYSSMRRRDLVTVSREGAQVAGRRGPSRELALHLAIYAARPDVGAVVHTHSPYATAWSFLDAPLAPATEEVSYYGIGTVVTAAYAPPGSAELARSACASLAGGRGVLLARHGVLAAAASVDEALSVAAAIEHQATVAWLLRADVADSPAPLSLRRFAAALAN